MKSSGSSTSTYPASMSARWAATASVAYRSTSLNVRADPGYRRATSGPFASTNSPSHRLRICSSSGRAMTTAAAAPRPSAASAGATGLPLRRRRRAASGPSLCPRIRSTGTSSRSLATASQSAALMSLGSDARPRHRTVLPVPDAPGCTPRHLERDIGAPVQPELVAKERSRGGDGKRQRAVRRDVKETSGDEPVTAPGLLVCQRLAPTRRRRVELANQTVGYGAVQLAANVDERIAEAEHRAQMKGVAKDPLPIERGFIGSQNGDRVREPHDVGERARARAVQADPKELVARTESARADVAERDVDRLRPDVCDLDAALRHGGLAR